MGKRNQHVVPLGNGWAVKREGNSKYTIITETKKDALIFGRNLARSNKSELVIHGRDGKIQEKDSYENNPKPIKDKV